MRLPSYLNQSTHPHRPQNVRKCALRRYAFPTRHPGLRHRPISYLTLRALDCRATTALLASLFLTFENGMITRSRHILLDSLPSIGPARQQSKASFNGECSALKIGHFIDDTGVSLSSWADFNSFAKCSRRRISTQDIAVRSKYAAPDF